MVEGKVLHKFLEDGLVKLGLRALETLQVGLPLVVLFLEGEAGDRVQEFLEGGQRQMLGRHFANYYKSAGYHIAIIKEFKHYLCVSMGCGRKGK